MKKPLSRVGSESTRSETAVILDLLSQCGTRANPYTATGKLVESDEAKNNRAL